MSRNYSSISEPKTLTADVSSVATQITLNNVTGLPSVPYVLVLNPDTASEEVILVTTDQTGVTSPTLKVSRAIETGASAKTHTNGDTVKHMIVGSDLQLPHDHIDNTTTAHGVSGAVVGTTNTQTLTNKTLTSPKINENVALTATSTELNVLDGITASTTELNYVDGVTSAIQTQLTANATPAGVVSMWVTGTAPTGWLLCQGQAVSRTTYATLFGVISTTYGVGDNSTTFNLPDLRGRVPMGAGTGRNVADSANLTARTLGTKVSDAETHTLTTAEMPAHTHDLSPGQIVGTGSGGTNAYSPLGNNPQTATTITSTGGGGAHNNTQPSTVINFIIKH
jgi:microcystin-dependent protein